MWFLRYLDMCVCAFSHGIPVILQLVHNCASPCVTRYFPWKQSNRTCADDFTTGFLHSSRCWTCHCLVIFLQLLWGASGPPCLSAALIGLSADNVESCDVLKLLLYSFVWCVTTITKLIRFAFFRFLSKFLFRRILDLYLLNWTLMIDDARFAVWCLANPK